MEKLMLQEIGKELFINEEIYQTIKKKLDKKDDYFSFKEYEILKKYNNI